MKKKIIKALLCAVLSIVSFSSLYISYAAQFGVPLGLSILPGTFHLSIFGDLQDGLDLSGIGAADSQPKTGYWNSSFGDDFMVFFDSTDADGYRIQFFLGSDFIYSGTDSSQDDIPASNFKVYAKYDPNLNIGLPPTIGFDDLNFTLSLDSSGSCDSISTSDFNFNSDFHNDDYALPLSIMPKTYLFSSAGCISRGIINLGRFELDLGVPSAGEYKAALVILMIDGV